MLTWLFRQYGYFFVLLRTHDSPRQLAAGFAMGLVLGLVPKGNLLAVALVVLLFSLRVNLSVGMITAACVGFVGAWIDPLSHAIGIYFLEHDSLQATWLQFANTPLVPWTRFNNSIVLGSFILGVSASYPAYRCSLPLFVKLHRRLAEQAAKKGPSRAVPLEQPPSQSLVNRPATAADRTVDRQGASQGEGDSSYLHVAANSLSDEQRRLSQRRFREFLAEIDRISQAGRAA